MVIENNCLLWSDENENKQEGEESESSVTVR